ncbi:Ger(x)C family spore germination protein [Paenibacillus sp. FSL H8-0548]|uniref:Ger(x)C family spore germination protein n=1 Tax=Paenibacillus sp. FSL H8-0548 TaxID=1920422 RepID=UPI0015C3410F|nr:Ger(x)C family spore germination protein [Paenibacillus sp. FSL H8-0548]
MRKILLLWLAIGLGALLVTGCWNRRELDDLAIQLGTSIDKVGNQYRVAVQVVIPGEVAVRSSSTGISPVTLYHATAPTMFEAFRKLTETSSRKIYSAHIRVLVIGESLAREGIGEVLDMFSRNPEARTDFYLMVARNTSAMQVLKTLTSLEKIPAENLFYALDTSAKEWAPTTTVTIEKLIEELVTEGLSPVLTGVKMVGNVEHGEELANIQKIDPAARTRFIGLAVFRKDKLVGWLNEEQSRGYNYLMNNVNSSAGHLKCPEGGLIVLETLRSKTRIKADIQDGKPVMTVKVKNVSSVSDVECRIDLTSPETIKQLEKESEEKFKELMSSVINHVKERYGFDIFGFGHKLYQAHPREWEKRKEEWDEQFKQLEIKYDIDVQIHKIGTTNDSFLNYIKE